MDCQYCERSFSTKGSLTYHQKTAKYCLKIQGKLCVKTIKKIKNIHFKCITCDKEFNKKYNLDRHYKVCSKFQNKLEDKDKEYNKQLEEYKKQLEEYKKNLEDKDKKYNKQLEEYKKNLEDKDKEYNKQLEEYKKKLEDKDKEYNNQLEEYKIQLEEYKKKLEDKDKECKIKLEVNDKRIEEYKQQISTLQDKLENIALKNCSRTTINNNNNQRTIMINNYLDNMEPITPEMLLSYTDKLTEEHMLQGEKGITKYFCEYPMKGNVLCTDISRKKIKYKDAEGNIQTDVNLSKLKKGMFESIKPKVIELKEAIDNSDRFKIDTNLPLGDQKYYEDKNLESMCNIINVCVTISDECKGNIDTELGQMVCKKVIEQCNI